MTEDPVQQYMTGQVRPGHAALLATFEREGDDSLLTCRPELDVAYGRHPRERFDF
jgi:hypothetical protein